MPEIRVKSKLVHSIGGKRVEKKVASREMGSFMTSKFLRVFLSRMTAQGRKILVFPRHGWTGLKIVVVNESHDSCRHISMTVASGPRLETMRPLIREALPYRSR